ncbi:MAG: hypothetical protein WDM89_22075 [Rhizomicrobium sp.]
MNFCGGLGEMLQFNSDFQHASFVSAIAGFRRRCAEVPCQIGRILLGFYRLAHTIKTRETV